MSKSIKFKSSSADRKKGPSTRKQHNLLGADCSDIETCNEEYSKRKNLSKNEKNHNSPSKDKYQTIEINTIYHFKDELYSRTVAAVLQKDFFKKGLRIKLTLIPLMRVMIKWILLNIIIIECKTACKSYDPHELCKASHSE